MKHRVFGIRHHGPGGARSLRAALTAFEPDCVLLEGPPDAHEALALTKNPELRPPVALLIHHLDDPRRAVFYPFAIFSPEWQAIQYANERGLPARFIDLPVASSLAIPNRPVEREELESGEDELRDDPLGMLAEAAGFEDREQWWDVQVEQRKEAAGLFDAIREVMTELRAPGMTRGRESEREELREAHMRTAIRRAIKERFERVAVVCGAWHVPALVDLGSAKDARTDAERLKGLPKLKVASTWIPWTHSRLAYRSGYGAGVESPGWYAHLWEHEHRAPAVWAVRAARLLRSEDLDASSASVIDTVRLADALAVVRELPAPGLNELREAVLAALCGGDAVKLALVRERLEIGEQLGSVPEGAPQVPLQRDFEKEARRLRLKLTTDAAVLELDLRKENDRDKSRLFRRLGLLGLEWAELLGTGNTTGTFRENWRVEWDPEFALELVAANQYGNTIEEAAQAKLKERAKKAHMADLANLLELALLAGLPDALADLLAELDSRAAAASDVALLLNATEPLARVIRYGDVRGSRADTIGPVFAVILERAIVGLAPACANLADEAAGDLLEAIERAHAACLLRGDANLRSDWLDALATLSDAERVHARIRGRACRLLVEQNRLTREDVDRRASLALGRAVDPAHATRWLEGLIAGDGLFLVHHPTLIEILDGWLSAIPSDVFQAELPLLRRAFSSFAPAERRALGKRLKRVGSPGAPSSDSAPDFDGERARRVLPVLASILGVEHG